MTDPLEPEQDELLARMVDAESGLPRERRGKTFDPSRVRITWR